MINFVNGVLVDRKICKENYYCLNVILPNCISSLHILTNDYIKQYTYNTPHQLTVLNFIIKIFLILLICSTLIRKYIVQNKAKHFAVMTKIQRIRRHKSKKNNLS